MQLCFQLIAFSVDANPTQTTLCLPVTVLQLKGRPKPSKALMPGQYFCGNQKKMLILVDTVRHGPVQLPHVNNLVFYLSLSVLYFRVPQGQPLCLLSVSQHLIQWLTMIVEQMNASTYMFAFSMYIYPPYPFHLPPHLCQELFPYLPFLLIALLRN